MNPKYGPGEWTLAMIAARKAAVAEMLAEGRKRRDLEAREISQAALAYLHSHPELFEQAQKVIQRVPSLLKLSQRWARANLTSGAQHKAP